MDSKASRIVFYAVLILSFLLGVFFKQFDIFVYKPFVLAAFCGTIGLLWDYAWRIRKSWWALVPFLTAAEFMGDLLIAAGFKEAAFWVYLLSATLFPVYGILFVRRGMQLWPTDRPVAWKFMGLGLLSSSLFSWEVATYFPKDFDYSHIWFRVLYLLVFAWLLFVDMTVDFSKRTEMKIEKQILRLSLLVMTAWYFVRFVFK